jgi:hypothetical protein
MTLYDLRQLT